ncbi:YhgE/Pip domain-containing protein [Gordonibacter massiliensis (ex Traore et al. 2017)]|uniref:YhgE/Pip domain-containing protein n=1 Tax=Gordonibacter massiliensis (ex Traore et al. 2017) TaxID=1841863 RepID=UPI001C8B6195|nr:ABC transporter permease [Gordonibacter massiliensis (ex Traore et al. 2017)]MBX9035347.1 DUF3533 domain-containing protein [Gordonibacter massiliensis (ex Traore et al. 2017)]
MFERLGKAKYVVPLVLGIVVACVMSVMFYPMANMEMKGLPFAVLSLDEGVETPQGTMNVGETMIEGITSSTATEDGEESPIAWTKVGSQEELDEALENGEYYGALIVPADFSAQQMAAKQAETQASLAQAQALMAAQAQAQAQAAAAAAGGAAAGGDASTGDQAAAMAAAASGAAAAGGDQAAALAAAGQAGSSDQAAALAALAGQSETATEAEEVEAPALKVIIDKAKSPLVASQMSTSISSMFQQMGVDVDVETIHTGSAAGDDAASANPMSGMVSLQLAIMPLFMVSMMTGLFLSRIFKKKPGEPSAARWQSIGIQAAYAVAASLIVSLCAYCMLLWVAGIEAPMGAIVPFMWLASFCVMLLFIGAFNISTGLGALLAVIGFALGMMTGTFPFEALPAFWQDWVYPWAPQRFMSEGIRAILYLDAGAWNVGSAPLVIVGAVGAVLACIAALIPGKKVAKEAAAA